MQGNPSAARILISKSRIEDFDVAVAARTLALGATLVTDNTEPLNRVAGLNIENWYWQVQ